MAKRIRSLGTFDWKEDKTSYPITLDTETGTFRIDLKPHDKDCVGTELEKVKKEAADWLRANAALVYEPVIVVEVEDFENGWNMPKREAHSIHFKYDRMFRATRKDGAAIWKSWQNVGDIPEGDGNNWDDCLEGKPGHSTHEPYRSKAAIIPYTNEQWIGLRKITKMFVEVQRRLIAIRESGKMGDFLLETSKKDLPLMLPAPKVEKK
jgi:hypothetical protein